MHDSEREQVHPSTDDIPHEVPHWMGTGSLFPIILPSIVHNLVRRLVRQGNSKQATGRIRLISSSLSGIIQILLLSIVPFFIAYGIASPTHLPGQLRTTGIIFLIGSCLLNFTSPFICFWGYRSGEKANGRGCLAAVLVLVWSLGGIALAITSGITFE